MADDKDRQDRVPQGGAQSIRRTISILRSVSKYNEEGVKLSGIARDVALPPSTVHRILAVLVEEEFVSMDVANKLYHLGTELYALGASTRQFSIRDRYFTALQRISDQTGDATYLVVRSGYDGVCIERVLGSARVQVLGFEPGERRLIGVGAAGQALLSFQPESLREEIIRVNTPRYKKYYNIEPGEIRGWIERTRRLKYSLSVHKVTPDSIGVGAPIFNTRGQVVAAVSVAGITARMSRKRCREIAGIILSEIAAVGPAPF